MITGKEACLYKDGLQAHLSFREVEILSELLPLLPDHVLVLLERLLQLQQLVRGEGCSDPFWFSERQQEFGEVWTWKEATC